MKNEIKLHYEIVEEIIDMLKVHQEHQLYILTDFTQFELYEDRLSYAKDYIQAGDMIQHLKNLLNERTT